MMDVLKFYQVDAFSVVPFGGNPAAICFMQGEAPDSWLQALAEENNLSETAYIWPIGGANRYRLRWFTPATEVDLCGHATLASAAALDYAGVWGQDTTELVFETRSGDLTVRRVGGSPDVGSRAGDRKSGAPRYQMDFPLTPAIYEIDAGTEKEVLAALGISSCVAMKKNTHDLLVEVDAAETVVNLAPDFRALAALDARGVMATARGNGLKDGAGNQYDFVSRFFAPAEAIDEDPVTGSAHCTLGPWWSERLGKVAMRARQCSKRGGDVLVEIAGERALVTGSAVIIFEAVLQPIALTLDS